MIRAQFFFFSFLFVAVTEGVPSRPVCSYQDVLDHLNLSRSNEVFRLTRPVLDHTTPTHVELNVALYFLLALVEKTQTFVPFIWTSISWKDERIRWDPDRFCGMAHVVVPRELLWEPDLFIYEATDKDASLKNPFLSVFHDGTVLADDDVKVVCSCRMDLHKFPFDTQRCNLTLGSAAHTVDEIRLHPSLNSSRVTDFTREILGTQGEWEFVSLSVHSNNFSYSRREWDTLTYTFTVRRRPLLHVLNLLVPVMFLLLLDLASFFISDRRGDKLSFKVTVLLAISVLLLMLQDILPCTSDHTPLIATFCIVIFAMMLISILETILVTFLMERSQRIQDNGFRSRDDGSLKMADGCQQHTPLCISEESPESRVLLCILDEVRRLQGPLSAHAGPHADSPWARRVDAVFFSLYVLVVALFLPCMFRQWLSS